MQYWLTPLAGAIPPVNSSKTAFRLRAWLVALTLGAFLSFAQDVRAGRLWFEDGHLWVEIGDYRVGFVEKANYTLHQMDYRGSLVMSPRGWYQSVVYDTNAGEGNDPYVGSGHGKEEVISIKIDIDGISHELAELDQSQTYPVNQSVAVRRRTNIGTFFRYDSDVSISPTGLAEDFAYETAGDTSGLRFMHAFMHCFSNDTQQWIAGKPDGDLLTGQFTDDRSFSCREDFLWAALYDPTNQIGTLYQYPEMYIGKGKRKNNFWNRSYNNKLYFTVEARHPIGQTFGYSVKIECFQAGSSEWKSQAEQLLKENYPPEIVVQIR